MIIVGAGVHRFEIPFDPNPAIVIGRYSEDHEEDGPDLTFAQLLNPTHVGTIKSFKSFYPLAKNKLKAFSALPLDRVSWIVSGAPAELSCISSTPHGETVRKIGHFVGGGNFVERSERDGFDYVTIRMFAAVMNYPSNYRGVSGGGVWVMFREAVDPQGTELKSTVSMILVGVAYWQTYQEPKLLNLHGPKSIYERVVNALANR